VRPDCLARQEWEQKLLERGSLIRVVIGLHGLMTTPAPPRQSMRLLGDYITWEAVGRAPAMIHLKGNEEFQQHVRDVVARLDALGIHLENLPPKCALLTVLRLCDDRETSRRVKVIMRAQQQGYDTTVGAVATAGAVDAPAAVPALGGGVSPRAGDSTTAGAVATGAPAAGGGTRQPAPDNSKTLPEKLVISHGPDLVNPLVTGCYGEDATKLATGMLEIIRRYTSTDGAVGGMTVKDLERCLGRAGRLTVIQLLCLAYYASCEVSSPVGVPMGPADARPRVTRPRGRPCWPSF